MTTETKQVLDKLKRRINKYINENTIFVVDDNSPIQSPFNGKAYLEVQEFHLFLNQFIFQTTKKKE